MKRCPARGRPPLTPKLKTEPGPFGRYLLRALVVRMRGEPGPVHELDAVVGGQPFGDGAGVVDVRLHPVGKGLDAQREQERGVRRERRTDVAQLLGAQAGEERVLAEVAVPVESAVVGDLLVEEREAVVRPVEASALDDDAAEGRAVTAEELGGRVDDDVGAPLDRTVQVGGRDRRVDDERGCRARARRRRGPRGRRSRRRGWRSTRRRSASSCR